METIAQQIAGAASFLCAGALSFIVLTRRIQEGVVMKAGLVMMIGALLATGMMAVKQFDSLQGFWNAAVLLRCGLLVTILGYVWRVDGETKRHKNDKSH